MKKAIIIASLALAPAAASPNPVTEIAVAASPAPGDLAQFEAMANDTLKRAESGDMAAAARRISDFETAWDAAQSQFYPLNNEEWVAIDTAADRAISSLRAKEPSPAGAKLALKGLIKAMQNPSMK